MSGLFKQTIKRGLYLFASILLATQSLMPLTAAANPPSTPADVCPNTDGSWTKYDNWADTKKSQTHDAGDNKIIAEVCIKGGSEKITYLADELGEDVCWRVEGIGTQQATVSENWEGDDKDLIVKIFHTLLLELKPSQIPLQLH